MKNRYPIAGLLLTPSLLTLLASCASPTTSQTQPAVANARDANFEIPGLGRINTQTDRKESVIARFGSPVGEERHGAQGEYQVLSYVGTKGQWLLLFHKDEILGVFCQSARNSLESTLQAHVREKRGETILFQSWWNGETVYFIARQEQLEKAPKCHPVSETPPLEQAEAERLAREWRERIAPDVQGEPKVQKLLESKSVPGACYYLVDMGNFASDPNLRQVPVLMDGSVVAGTLDNGSVQRSTRTAGHEARASGTSLALSEGPGKAQEASEGRPGSPPAAGAPVPRVMIEGRNTYFLADLKKVTNSDGKPPLSPSAAEQLAKAWLRRMVPEQKGSPKVSELSKLPGGSGQAYYHVELGVAKAPIRLREILVLMDGTIVESAMR